MCQTENTTVYEVPDIWDTKNYCTRSPRCVKCAGNHLTTDCTMTGKSNKDVRCVNHDKNHPVN